MEVRSGFWLLRGFSAWILVNGDLSPDIKLA